MHRFRSKNRLEARFAAEITTPTALPPRCSHSAHSGREPCMLRSWIDASADGSWPSGLDQAAAVDAIPSRRRQLRMHSSPLELTLIPLTPPLIPATLDTTRLDTHCTSRMPVRLYTQSQLQERDSDPVPPACLGSHLLPLRDRTDGTRSQLQMILAYSWIMSTLPTCSTLLLHSPPLHPTSPHHRLASSTERKVGTPIL